MFAAAQAPSQAHRASWNSALAGDGAHGGSAQTAPGARPPWADVMSGWCPTCPTLRKVHPSLVPRAGAGCTVPGCWLTHGPLRTCGILIDVVPGSLRPIPCEMDGALGDPSPQHLPRGLCQWSSGAWHPSVWPMQGAQPYPLWLPLTSVLGCPVHVCTLGLEQHKLYPQPWRPESKIKVWAGPLSPCRLWGGSFLPLSFWRLQAAWVAAASQQPLPCPRITFSFSLCLSYSVSY